MIVRNSVRAACGTDSTTLLDSSASTLLRPLLTLCVPHWIAILGPTEHHAVTVSSCWMLTDCCIARCFRQSWNVYVFSSLQCFVGEATGKASRIWRGPGLTCREIRLVKQNTKVVEISTFVYLFIPVSEVTYIVSSGMLNSTIPLPIYHIFVYVLSSQWF